MKAKVFLVKAFTKDKNAWNPAWVVFDADSLDYEQMLNISKKLWFSESVFISKSNKADFKLRFFSVKEEVDLCGHATIAAFYALVKKWKIDFWNRFKKILTQETNLWILNVECDKSWFITMEQKVPEFHVIESDRGKISRLLNIKVDDLGNYPIQSVSTWAHKLIVSIKSLEILLKIKPDFDSIISYCKEKSTRGLYLFTFDTLENWDFHTRQFSPLIWINEDPITWIAWWALWAYAVKHSLLGKTDFVIEQWYIMSKFGRIYVKVINNLIRVWWYACIYWEIKFEI